MSPRPSRPRKISNPPPISGFRPYGTVAGGTRVESIFLHIEEYEAIRLCDHQMLNHEQAALLMAVSRPTLTRIYSKARKKVAEALVLGKQIIIEGGKVYFDSDWFECKSCGCFFNNPEKQNDIEACPLCRSIDFSLYGANPEEHEELMTGNIEKCVCPGCGFEKTHIRGCPCREEICTECGEHLVRMGSLT